MNFYNIINSEKRDGASTTKTTDPRNGESLCEVPIAVEQDLYDAVAAASIAFKSWKLRDMEDRKKILLQLADELEARREEIHPVLARETGKSVRGTLLHRAIADTEKGSVDKHGD